MDDPHIGFEIDGEFYDMPLFGSLDMDENRIFHKATGLHAEDVWLGLNGGTLSFAELMRKEGFLTALVHIAYRREHEDLGDDRIAAMVGKLNRLEVFASLVNSMTDDEGEDPKESGTTSVPNESSTSSNDEKPSSKPRKAKRSGKTSKTSSGQPDDDPGSTGTGESDTFSTSDRLRRVV